MMIQSNVYETVKQDLFIGLHWHYSENLVSHSSKNYEFIERFCNYTHQLTNITNIAIQPPNVVLSWCAQQMKILGNNYIMIM